jgi:dTDP-4-amino-4,6-dideoxygalactose transaminase
LIVDGDGRSACCRQRQRTATARRYFYPLISNFEPYRELPSASPENLTVATQVAKEVLCLPIYVELSISQVCQIVELIRIN